jgi:hypothetical protein
VDGGREKEEDKMRGRQEKEEDKRRVGGCGGW